MPFRRATADDVRPLSITAMRAFADDPVMRWLVPDDRDYFAPDGALMSGAVRDWIALDELWCTDDGVALAAWIPPGRPDPPKADPPPPPTPADRAERFRLLGGLLDAHTPTEPHWYLQMLATHPDWQRQGLGGALMEQMFERSDDESLPCWLETETDENVAYYRRFGFDVRSEWDIPDGPHMWGMLRPVP